jgi:hypothetical protein
MNLSILLATVLVHLSASAPQSDPFYGSWMGMLHPFLQNLTLLDLSLPGTHDTMTFDLSTTVSDNANDLPANIASLLHEFHTELQWLEIGNFMRNQSKTQGLSITEQLDAGVRFVDFRTIFTGAPDSSGTNTSAYDWYCLHFVQSKTPSIPWLQDVREWLDAHPREIIVLWISKHGNNCGTHYSGIANNILQAYWKQIQSIFNSVLFNTTQGRPLNETTIGELLDRGQRVVVYLTDFDNFTGTASPIDRTVAYTDCLIDNEFSTHATNATDTVVNSLQAFRDAEVHIHTRTKPNNEFYLLSMAADPTDRLTDAVFLRYFNILLNVTNETESCADVFHIPGFYDWCPMHLQDSSQLVNYYNQIPLGAVAESTTLELSLPNAIYIDTVDVNGTIRTGTTLFGPGYPDGWTDQGATGHGLTGFGYVDVFALTNLRRGCKQQQQQYQHGAYGISATPACQAMEAELMTRYRTHPVVRWSDVGKGRLENWPVV